MTRLSIEMPEGVFSALKRSPVEFARETRVAAAVHGYGRGEISQGRGAEIAGLSRREFLEALHRAAAPACQETIEELREDVDRDLQARRERLALDPSGEGRIS